MNFNTVYIGAGVAIILALVTALVGPYLVDWTAYRAAFEARAEAILGHPVTVLGTADAQILPNPSLTFTDVRVGDPDDPIVTIGRISARLELFPLISGDIQIIDMQVEGPTAKVRIAEDGRFEWLSTRNLAAGSALQRVTLDQLDVTDGTLRIEDVRRNQTYEVTGINAAVDARALTGPWRFDGNAFVGGVPTSIRIATGELGADGQLRLRVEAIPANYPLGIVVEGIAGTSDERPSFEGTLSMRRIVDPEGKDELAAEPWTLDAGVSLDSDRLLAREVEYSLGPEDRRLRVSGAATVTLVPQPRFEAVLSSRQLDVDRLLGASPDAPARIADLLPGLGEALAQIGRPPIPGRIGFDIPGIVVGGGIVQDIRFDAAFADGSWQIDALEARLPGSSRVAANGRLAPDGSFIGNVAVNSDQPSALVAWLRPDGAASRLQPFAADAAVVLSAAGVSLTGIDAALGDAAMAGQVVYETTRGSADPRLTVELRADMVDLSQVEELVGLLPLRGDGAPDVRLALAAERVRYGALAATGVDIAAGFIADDLNVERLRVADLAGASIAASGRIADLSTTPQGMLQGDLIAEDFGGLADLAAAVAPSSPFARFLRRSGPSLAPARLSATVEAGLVPEGTSIGLSLSGAAAGTAIDADFGFTGRVNTWRDAAIELTVALDAPDGGRLATQLGLGASGVSGEPGRLSLSASGAPSGSIDLDLDASLAATSLSVAGDARLPQGRPAEADLAFDLVSGDAGPLLALATNILPDLLPGVPANLAGEAHLADRAVRFDGLTGDIAGTDVSGDLALDLAGDRPRWSGTLATGALDLGVLAELALGPQSLQSPLDSGAGAWSDAPFGASLLGTFDGTVSLTAPSLRIADGFVLDGLALDVRSADGAVGFDGITGTLAGGSANGALRFGAPTDAGRALGLDFSLTGGSLEELGWQRGGRGVATGALDLSVNVEGIGRSLAGVVASLSGEGAFAARDGQIRGINAAAFDAVIRAADAGLALEADDIATAFSGHLDAGTLAFQRAEGTFSVVGGTLRAGNVAVDTPSATTLGSAVVDLNALTVQSSLSVAVDPGADAVAGARPEVGLVFSGPLAAPERSLDVTPFLGFLQARAFEAELREVEELQSEILERERLLRQLTRQNEEAAERRRAEEREAAERRRAEEEADARAAEAERLAAEEAARVEAEAAAARLAEQVEAARLAEEAAQASAAAERAAAEQAAPAIDEPAFVDGIGDLLGDVGSPPPLAPPRDIGPPPGAGDFTAPEPPPGISGGTLPGVF
jgi:uncharacterized protein involved in outer membrane biogenesis